jgi:hypothetical protein
MQNLPIYLYQNNFDVILDLDPTIQGVNRVMYQRDLTIQKGIKNKIRVTFKNSDQKILPISSTATYVFSMFDAISQRLLIQKQITVLDDTITTQTNVDQSNISNVLSFSDTSGFSIGQTVTGFGIHANSVITGISTGTITLNNFTIFPVSSSTVLTVGTLNLRGVGQLTFTESDTIGLDDSSYTYSITYKDPTDGTYLPAYSNTYYGINGTLYLTSDIWPTLQPSFEVDVFQQSFNLSVPEYEFKSRPIYAYPEYKSNTGLHTVAFYMTNFIGTVYLQVTMDNQPSYLDNFSTIETRTYNGFSGIDYINFNGIYSYINVMYVPAKGPGDSVNNNPAYYGSFDKLLYRC